LAAALETAFRDFGPPTVLVYAPAVNEPKRVTELDAETVRRALEPKTRGLDIALKVLGPQLRRLVTFGSIIGRIGLEGESHYALANAMQTVAAQDWAAAQDGRTALAIEWSVWGGPGMGERLGTIDRLEANGVDALSVDDGLAAFDRLMRQGAIGPVTVTSRFGPPPDLSLGNAELPILRFVDVPKVHFPGVELVVETALCRGSDPYLGDHVINGQAVFPAVMGLEAMAQVASALAPLDAQLTVSNVTLTQAVHVVGDSATRVRIAALRSDAQTDVDLFSEADGFSAPCMRATFCEGRPSLGSPPDTPRHGINLSAAPLYGPLFFNGERFQRVDRFAIASSKRVVAQLRPNTELSWFGAYEVRALSLWDPGATDAVLHALQVAIPHRKVLPISVDKIEINTAAGAPAHLHAVERTASGNIYTFDLIVSDENWRTSQRWTNVTFRAIADIEFGGVLSVAPSLAAPYLERVAREALNDDTIEVAFVYDNELSREARRVAALDMLGLADILDRRGDGCPMRTDGRGSISIAHSHQITVAASASNPISCDIEFLFPHRRTDDEFILRHVVSEVCRKLGRMGTKAATCTLALGSSAIIDDVDIVAVELPIPSCSYKVAFGRLRTCSGSEAQENSHTITEAVL
jgi:enediyne polyketide synthase